MTTTDLPIDDHSLPLSRVTAKGFKALSFVDIEIDGAGVVLKGKNGAGKSSVIDAIWSAVGGRDASSALGDVVRRGEDTAEVVTEFGDLTIRRRWTNGRSTLTVTGGGIEFKKPQEVLDALAGGQTIDPIRFAEHMTPKEQRAVLLELVDLPFDLDALEQERASVYEQRTAANRKVRELATQLDDCPPAPADTPDEEVSVAALAAELNEATEHNNRISTARTQALTLQNAIADLEQQLAAAHERLAIAAERLRELGGPVDTDELQDRIAAAESVNQSVRDKRRRDDVAEAHADAVAVAKSLDDRIAEIDKQKVAGLAAAKMPVEGLGIDGDTITLNGVPFAQASSGERIRVAMAIAMANPNRRLKVLLVRDGSLLDNDNRQVVFDMAAERGYRVVLESVGEEASDGELLIVDGEVHPATRVAPHPRHEGEVQP